MARMSRPIMNATMVGNMPAIMAFIDSHSGMNRLPQSLRIGDAHDISS